MTDDPHILICARCSKPMRIAVIAIGPTPAAVHCPYCQAENLSRLGGRLRAEMISADDQTYFWDAETRRDATSGVDLAAPEKEHFDQERIVEKKEDAG